MGTSAAPAWSRGPHASLLDAVALPGMDEPCHATRHTSHAHDGVHTNAATPARIFSHSAGSPARTARGWACMRACEQTLTALPACCMQHRRACLAASTVRAGYGCGVLRMDAMYTTLARPPGAIRGTSRSDCSVLSGTTIYHCHIPSIASARPSSQPAALCSCRPSVRYSGRALTTLLCPPPQDRTLTDALPAPLTRSGVRGLLAVLGQPLIDSTGCALRVGSTGLTI